MDKAFYSQFDMEKLQRVQQRLLRPELEELPSKEELLGSVMKKNGNVTGESGIRTFKNFENC